MSLSREKVLEESDFPFLPEELNPRASTTLPKLKLGQTPLAFLLSLLPVYQERLKWAYGFQFVALVASLMSPVLIHRFVQLLQQPSDFLQTLACGIVLGLTGVVTGLCFQQYFFNTLASNQLITNDLNQLIYKQSLELSLKARSESQVGDIVNHMSSDTEAVADIPIVIGDLFWALGTVVVASVLLYHYIGISAVPAWILLLGLIPMTKWIARKFVRLEEKMMEEKDRRLTLMSQILTSIRVIKYFAWENAVQKEVSVLREAELGSRRKLARSEVLSGVSYVAVSTVVLFVALYTHALRGERLDAALVFTCISLFSLLEEPFGNLSRLFSRFSQAWVSVRRILEFLQKDRVSESSQTQVLHSAADAVVMKRASFGYGESAVVRDLDLNVPVGSSLAIVGPVGSGKTTLLLGLLGECRTLAGQVSLTAVDEKRAYVPQEAFIVNSTLLENVTFGNENFSKENLRRAIHQACLDKDIQELPAGLRTEIGERGVNLSGGQKQRVSLARAAFSNPSIVFLDDPLSAVDVETETFLCDRLLFGEWQQKKVTRIVATHRLESLQRFDQILFLKNGRAEAVGPLSELLQRSEEFRKFFVEHENSKDSSLEVSSTESLPQDLAESSTRITEDEDREKGAVKASLFWDYLLSLRGPRQLNSILVGLALISLFASVLPLLQKAWIGNYQNSGGEWTPLEAVLIYGLLGILVLVVVVASQMSWLSRGLEAGRIFHDRMLERVLGAPVRFFDSTPVGRILQRFSRDLESVDIYLQWSFESFIHCVLHVLVSLVLVMTLLPFMIVVILPVLWFYYRIQNDYRRPAREAKRFDSIARSPRYAHFKETLMGLAVVRAFRKRDWFLESFFQKLTQSQRMFYGHYMLNRWFSSRVPLIAGMISVATLSGVAWAVHEGYLHAGTGGLVTIYALTFWGQLNWGIRIFADIESRMTSIERLKFYSNLQTEGRGDTVPVPQDWPSRGDLQIRGLKVRYAPHLPWVLKGLDFSVLGGKKVGIVGRTGSGKTTLFQSLYRFIEAEEGAVSLDGIDISKVDLHRLRRSLAIVPQDPSLFMGTLRSNLDRYNEFSDEDVWAALRDSGLEPMVQALPGALSAAVSENGVNFSQGQRQLICLARALLMKARLVLMDEATASVDVQTDRWIQKVISEKLKAATMLVIAHRLGTLKDCDLVLELADGCIKKIHDPSRESASQLEALLSEEPSPDSNLATPHFKGTVQVTE